MVYYHLTKFVKLPKIMYYGLVPSVGQNSEQVGDDTPALYFCTKEYIDNWRIILDVDTLLEVNVPDSMKLAERQYHSDIEWVYEGTEAIPWDNCKLAPMGEISEKP